MENEIRNYRIRLRGSLESKTSEGTVAIQYWNHRARALRAAKFAGIFLGLALGAVLIPLLHFILVPALLLTSPVIAFVMYRQESLVIGGKGKCPECGAQFTVAKNSNRFPLDDLCTHCYKSVKVELLEKP